MKFVRVFLFFILFFVDLAFGAYTCSEARKAGNFSNSYNVSMTDYGSGSRSIMQYLSYTPNQKGNIKFDYVNLSVGSLGYDSGENVLVAVSTRSGMCNYNIDFKYKITDTIPLEAGVTYYFYFKVPGGKAALRVTPSFDPIIECGYFEQKQPIPIGDLDLSYGNNTAGKYIVSNIIAGNNGLFKVSERSDGVSNVCLSKTAPKNIVSSQQEKLLGTAQCISMDELKCESDIYVTQGQTIYLYTKATQNNTTIKLNFREYNDNEDVTPDITNEGGDVVNGILFKYRTNINEVQNENILWKKDYVTMIEDSSGYFDRNKVNGDYVIVGNRVNKATGRSNNFDEANMQDYKQVDCRGFGNFGGRQNCSKATVTLPPNITQDDIVYAKFFWNGSFQGGVTNDYDIGNGARYNYIYFDQMLARDEEHDRQKVIGIRYIDGVKFKIGDKIYSVNDLDKLDGGKAKSRNYYYTSVNRHGQFHYMYSRSIDVRKQIIDYIKDKDTTNGLEFEVTGANIPFSIGESIRMTSMLIGGSVSGTENSPNGYVYEGSYGNWSLIIVYDKKDSPKKTDRLYAYYKPKAVSVFAGLVMQAAPTVGSVVEVNPGESQWSIQQKIEETKSKSSLNIDIGGFFTPNSDDYSAKITINGSSASKNNTGEYVEFKSGKSDKYQSLQNKFNEVYNGYPSTGQLNGTMHDLIVDIDNCNDTDYSKCPYKFKEIATTSPETGFDIDTYDVNSHMSKNETNIKLKLQTMWMTRLNGGTAADVFIPHLIAFSTDLYVPDMCYMERVYDVNDWFKFYRFNKELDKDGVPTGKILGIEKEPKPAEFDDVRQRGDTLIAGQEVYYRVMFKNQAENTSTAIGTVIAVKHNNNTYTPNSVGVDNNHKGQDIYDNVDTKYMIDNTPGLYSRYDRVGSPTDTDLQYMTFDNGGLKFYLGEGAGNIEGGIPSGGKFENGVQKAFVEFNATVGTDTYKYIPIRYEVGFLVKDSGGNVIADYRNRPVSMSVCDEDKDYLDETTNAQNLILPLDGLKVVNQNVSLQKNSTTPQDDRLYTQVSELPFDVNLIYAPNLGKNKAFSSLCREFEKDANGKDTQVCKIFDNNKIEEEIANGLNLDDFFECVDGKCSTQTKQILKMPFKGDIEVSVITNTAAAFCSSITDNDKIKFGLNCNKGMPCSYDNIDYTIKDYNTNTPLFIPLKGVSISDSFQRATFMVTYIPSAELNINTNEKALQNLIQELRDRQTSSEKPLSDNEKAKLQELESQLEKINEISDVLGVKMSDDGTFKVCSSDFFTIRPASFTIVKPEGKKPNNAIYQSVLNNQFNRYAKIVDMSGTGDVTRKNSVSNDKALRVAGDYRENADVIDAFYAQSYLNNPVTNYDAIFGGSFTNRINLRSGFDLGVVNKEVDINGADQVKYKYSVDDVVREDKNAILPFISNKCVDSISSPAIYGRNDRSVVFLEPAKKGEKAKDCQLYNNFTYENGKYVWNEKGNNIELDTACAKKLSLVSEDSSAIGQKIWDVNGIPLRINFTYKDISISNGMVTNKTAINKNLSYRLKQANEKPSSKDANPGLLNIPSASNSKIDSKLKAEMFNYFNVGDVLVNLYDNTFTIYDQSWAELMNGDKYGPVCILNSTSNTHTEKDKEGAGYARAGMVGCDVGMEDNKFLVLSYQPKDIFLAITDIDNADDGFTYYNAAVPDNSKPMRNQDRELIQDKNAAVLRDVSQLAKIKISGSIFIDDSVYEKVPATLYDGRVIRGTVDSASGDSDKVYDVPVCGFANDINFKLANNGINILTGDDRLNTTPLKKELSNFNIYYDIDKAVSITPKVTSFDYITEETCKDSFSSLCLKASNKIITNDPNEGNEFEIHYKDSALFYSASLSDSIENSVLNQLDSSGIYNPKIPSWKILARGFNEGRLNDSTFAYINFERPHRKALMPTYIKLSDFSISNIDTKIDNKRLTPKFNAKYELLNNTGAKLIDETNALNIASNIISPEVNDISYVFTGSPYSNDKIDYDTFKTSVSSHIIGISGNNMILDNVIYGDKSYIHNYDGKTEDVTTYMRNNRSYAVFVYGAINAPEAFVENGKSIMGVSEGEPLFTKDTNNLEFEVDIKTMLYCGKANNCQVIPTGLSSLMQNPANEWIFNRLQYFDKGWFVNTLDITEGNVIKGPGIINTTTGYAKYTYNRNITNPQDKKQQDYEASITESKSLDQGVRTIKIKLDREKDKDSKEIRILVKPWFEFTDTVRNYLQLHERGYFENPVYFNHFLVKVKDKGGNWGGEGSIKGVDPEGKEDNSYVGGFVGTDDKGNFTNQKGNFQDKKPRQRIEW